jgi:hypothetical protein
VALVASVSGLALREVLHGKGFSILLAEYQALPEGTPTKRITGELLSRIRHILQRKNNGLSMQ